MLERWDLARLRWLGGWLCVATGCCPSVLEPKPSGIGAIVSTKPDLLVGFGSAANWQSGRLVVARDADPCPHDREKFERALGVKAADACGAIRRADAPASGNGDAPISTPVAPICYAVGSLILVAQYEESTTLCSRLVGIALVPRK